MFAANQTTQGSVNRSHAILSAVRVLSARDVKMILIHGMGEDGICTCRDANCGSPGKHPRASGWKESGTTDPALLEAQLAAAPYSNLAILTGEMSGVFVLDIDPRNGGDASLKELESRFGALPPTLTVHTGGGGLHLFFALPESGAIGNSTGRVMPGIDVKSTGGFVVTAGSIHASGKQYEFEDAAVGVAVPPAWLVDLISRPVVGQPAPASNVIPFAVGRRNNDLFRVGATLRARGLTEEHIEGALRGLNGTISSPLDDGEVGAIARSAGRYAPSSFSDLTDRGLAELLAARLVDKYLYTPEAEWMRYDAGVWSQDLKGLGVQEQAKNLAAEIRSQGLAYAAGQARNEAEKLKKAVNRIQSVSAIRAAVKLASSDPQIRASIDQFDRVSGLLAVENGVVDLRARALLDHAPKYRLTRRARVEYDPSAQCPTFDRFLVRILPGERAAFMCRALGYALLGTAGEQVMFLLVGQGRNGKTTLMNVVRFLLGPYAVVVLPDTFLRKPGFGGVSNDVARLKGAYLAQTSELPNGAILDAALVKRLTGNEPITARFLFQEYFEFTPTMVIFMVTNYLPVIDGSDSAMARRIITVPFDAVIPEEEVDPALQAKLEAERSGIFNRLLGGVQEYCQRGLAVPSDVQVATAKYTREADLVGAFVDETCELGEALKAGARDLYNEYRFFCSQQGVQPVSQPTFATTLERKGFTKRREASGVTWRGLAVRPIRL